MTSDGALTAECCTTNSAHGLARQGFVVVRRLLEPSELPPIKQMLDLALRLPLDQVCRRPHNTLVPLRWNDPIIHAVLNSASRLRALKTTAEAADLRWISGYISIKEPYSPALWWHQDWWCWDHAASYRRAPVQVALLCYLSETNIEDGALRVLPGSHHCSAPIHAVLPDAHAKAEKDPDPQAAAISNLPGQVTLSATAGDAVLIDYRLLHGTHPNHGRLRRDCVILNFAPNWARLPADIRAHLIRHPAQPTEDEAVPLSLVSALLPTFSGERRDLPLNRNAPAHFQVEDE
jgi:ectoine hydroxylase-related dioxygenase (phytanoyl-CoA dioxygenase family)